MDALPEFGVCRCSGRFETKIVEVRIAAREGTVTLNDIPQGKCPNCLSSVYRPDTLANIEKVYLRSKRSLVQDVSDDDRGPSVL